MGTVEDVLTIASKQIGVKESPPNSNKVLYNNWYYGREVSGKDYPWCMVFCQWVYDQAGIKVPIRTASCTAMLTAAKKNNCFVNNQHLAPGDLVLFDFNKTGNTSTHCGILKSITGIKMEVIEGNTSTTNDTNGGSVMLRNRTTSQVIGAFRPMFEEGGIDMTIDEFITKLSDRQAYAIWEKASRYLGNLPEPNWSKQEKHWAEATKEKVIDGTAPERPVKRDELIAILGRKNLL